MSDAISAQGSILHIATGSGGAKTITAISVGNPAIVTSAAHGLNNGDVVDLAAIVGTMSTILNGSKRVVANATANTFAMLDADTTGLTYTSGGTATPATYTEIGGVVSFDGFDGSASEIDVTHLRSTGMEYISGLKDEGKFGFEVLVLSGDPGQQALRAARNSGAVVGMKLTLPDLDVATFNALVKTMPASGAVNSALKGKIDTRITGSVIWS